MGIQLNKAILEGRRHTIFPFQELIYTQI